MKKWIYWCSLIFLLPSLFACTNFEKTEKATRIQTGTDYLLGFETDEMKTKLRLRFLEDGSMRLLHEDQTSPRFGMEELHQKDRVQSGFYDVQMDNIAFTGGTRLLYEALTALREAAPIKEEKTKEGTCLTFRTEEGEIEIQIREEKQELVQMEIRVGQKACKVNYLTPT